MSLLIKCEGVEFISANNFEYAIFVFDFKRTFCLFQYIYCNLNNLKVTGMNESSQLISLIALLCSLKMRTFRFFHAIFQRHNQKQRLYKFPMTNQNTPFTTQIDKNGKNGSNHIFLFVVEFNSIRLRA